MAGSESRIITGRSPTGEPRAVEVTAAGELLVTGGATQYQEDTPSAGGDLGTMTLAIRNDAGGTLVDANGDYAPLQVNAAGQLIIAGGAGGTSMADDAPFAPGTTQITPMGAMLDDVAPDTVNEGDAGIPRMSANRNLYVQVRDNAGNERGLNVDAGGRLGTNIHDGAGTALTSTVVGADQALDVNIVAGAGAGGTSMVDDAVFTPETTAFTPVGGTFDDVAPDSIAEGDAGVVRMSANRNIYVRVRDDQGNERGLRIDANGAIAVTDGGGALTVDNTVLSVVGGGAEATAQRVTIANDSTGVLSIDDNGGSLTVDNAALAVLGGGVEAGALRVTIANNSTGLLSVDDNGGSLTVDGGVTADIRDGAGVALTSTLVGADQALDVNIVQTVGGAGGTSMVDDAAFTPATTQITPAGAMFDDTAPDSVDEGDAGIVRMSANRNLYTTIRDAAGNERGLNVDANNRIGVTNPVLSVVGGGTEATAQRVTIANDSTGVLSVDDNAGSLTVDQATHDNLQCNANIQVGDADVANGNPVPISDAGGSITIDGTVAIQEPLSVDDNGGSLTVDNPALSVVGGGAEATAQRVTIANDSTGVLSVDDNAGSLTVDNAALSVVGGGTEATALRVTIANDSTGLLSIDDNGGSLTVDGAGTSMVDDAAFTPATTPVTPVAGFFDDTAPDSVDEGDAGVVRMSANRNLYTTLRDAAGNERGLNIDAAGAIAVTNAALGVTGGGAEATAQRVTIANDSTGVLTVDDGGASLTVDNAALSVVGGGTEATALRVTIANDSTGLISVDDNGGSLSVDDDGGSLTVDNPVLSVVGGGTEAAAQRVTIANDSTGVLSVDDNAGSLTVDNPVLSVVGGGAEATAQRVTIANDSTGVLSVDDAGGSLTVDGVVTADIRDGGGTALTSTLVGADQALDVNIVQTVGGAGGTSMADDAAFTPATTQVTPIAGFCDDTAPDSVDEGDAGAVRMSANRNMYVRIRDDAGNERGLNVDASGDIGITNAALAIIGGGVEAAALRVTIANDSTGLLSVDDNGGSLTVDQEYHDNLQCNANMQVGDVDVANGNPVPVSDAGGSLTVDGTLTVDIRDGAGTALTSTLVGADQALDVNIVAGAGAGGTSMIDDAAFTPATTAITPAGAMFDDVAPDSVDEGDAGIVRMSANRNLYVTLRDAAGNERGLNIDAGNNIGVTNAALSVVGGGAEATAQRVTIANDSTGVLTVDDGGASLTVDNPALSVVGGGVEATALRVTIANDSTGLVSVDDGGASLSVDDAGGSLTVDNAVLSVVGGGTEAAAQRVTIANDSTGVLSVDDNAGSLTVDNPVLSVVGGGAEATAQRVTIANDSTGVLSVDDGGGTLTVDGTVTASNTAGDTAHDAVDAGNPVKIGARAIETDGTDPGEVAEADRTDLKADLNGRLLVNTGHPNAWKTNNNYAAAQTDTALKAAPGANLSLYITSVILSTEGAQNIKIVRNTAASVDELGPYYFAANGGMVAMTFEPAIRIAANTNVGVTSSAAVNHTITLNGYTAP